MHYRGLDKPKGTGYALMWKVLFMVSIVTIAGLLYYATSKIEYIWRWDRVPQYFWINQEQDIHSEYDGTVVKVEDGQIIIENSSSSTQISIPLPKDTVTTVEAGYTLYYGETIGKYKVSKPGILLQGLWITLQVSALAIAIGIILGLLTGLCRISDNPFLRYWSVLYVEFIRGSPLLVQIFIWYFIVGTLIDKLLAQVGIPAIPGLYYGVFALAIFTGAYVAEIVRAGIQSVPRGQTEAARSLGMTYTQCMIKVILPQAFRRIMPPLAGQFISLIKDSSLLGVMSVRELTKATREATTASLQSFELWFVCAILYLALTFTLSLFVQYLERRAVSR